MEWSLSQLSQIEYALWPQPDRLSKQLTAIVIASVFGVRAIYGPSCLFHPARVLSCRTYPSRLIPGFITTVAGITSAIGHCPSIKGFSRTGTPACETSMNIAFRAYVHWPAGGRSCGSAFRLLSPKMRFRKDRNPHGFAAVRVRQWPRSRRTPISQLVRATAGHRVNN